MTTVLDVQRFKDEHRRFAMVTAYDYLSARILDEAGIPILLVGDSLGMVMLGYPTTLPVTLDEMIHHAKAVARGSRQALLVGDLPFMSYHTSVEQGIASAGRFIQEGGMHAVKLEGGGAQVVEITRRLTELGIPVMSHLGLTPQSIHQMGGFKVQGKSEAQAARILADAKGLEEAGAFSVVLEGVPSELASRVTQSLHIPTIGIGAGAGTDGQVLVYHDLLGLTTGKAPKFVKRYANLAEDIGNAVQRFARDVASGEFPGPENSYSANGAAPATSQAPPAGVEAKPASAEAAPASLEETLEVKYGAG
ncbi:MAG: 3-methyl-2-oxobutanoate hydroxymethyltransferase [Candidatus Dormibacteraceae bacterium]